MIGSAMVLANALPSDGQSLMQQALGYVVRVKELDLDELRTLP